jgi:lipopolysaccharide/colanic/teichoic acid biosynthesis glycosyltransferase
MGSKRVLDIVGATVGLTVAALPMAVIAVIVRLTMGSPVLFRQVRPGLHGEPFTIVKFRTMRGGEGTDAERLTRTGRLLRSTSLDELPELWNVLRGDMSLVGPRPLLMPYLDLYSERQARRHEVRPGLTGLAQVEGRNLLSWPDRLELDVRYVETRSFALDLRIMARTALAVLRRKGISAEHEVTMTPFRGDVS